MTAPRDPFFPSDRSIRSASEPPEIRRLGTVDYLEAWHLQADLAAARHRGEIGDVILVLEHPSTYTAGKRTQPEDLPDNGLPVIDVDRGGRITWHGEGQLVVYPVIELADPVDVVDYVRRLEEALIQTVRRVGVPDAGRIDGRSGVWVPADPDDAGGHVSTEPGALPGTILTTGADAGASAPENGAAPEKDEAAAGGGAGTSLHRPDRKVAALGIRVTHGVTMHGLALNCSNTLEYYHHIVPCGIRDAGVTTLSHELGRHVSVDEMTEPLLGDLVDALEGRLRVADHSFGSAPDPTKGLPHRNHVHRAHQ
ncbi:lipoyl(octanoyl) transferase LipB [Corynebacterium sp. MSK006]|uniref:lipoyl(octanoyl) transferase LipB n=1 Tax=Corynebacterium sp. MSK006 TaxID=3050187 RepID=UPI00254A6164|nr:lipoyl(octanoyl) transferase LipB [Corynebacterium sp. MSK006]MDK8894424.1 lipoyl(octanoyl) transferase LipB [Corynebacterium sp. MSK006]